MLQGVPQGAHVTTISSGVREVASPQGLEGAYTPPTVVLGPTTSLGLLGPTPLRPMARCNNRRLTKPNRLHLLAAGEAMVRFVLSKPKLSSIMIQTWQSTKVGFTSIHPLYFDI